MRDQHISTSDTLTQNHHIASNDYLAENQDIASGILKCCIDAKKIWIQHYSNVNYIHTQIIVIRMKTITEMTADQLLF